MRAASSQVVPHMLAGSTCKNGCEVREFQWPLSSTALSSSASSQARARPKPSKDRKYVKITVVLLPRSGRKKLMVLFLELIQPCLPGTSAKQRHAPALDGCPHDWEKSELDPSDLGV